VSKARLAITSVVDGRPVAQVPPHTRYRDNGSICCWPATSLEGLTACEPGRPHSQPMAASLCYVTGVIPAPAVMSVSHSTMIPAMLAVMLLRSDHYAGENHIRPK
jgi:hypothetical protein